MTKLEKNAFLEHDLHDALRWLFIGAVAWQAAETKGSDFGRMWVPGMLTSFVQARALYEFFVATGKRGEDDARARDFAPAWRETKTPLYAKYMDAGKPANKRVFHLVYGRSIHSGGEGADHLIKQVVPFANDLLEITQRIVACLDTDLQGSGQSALQRALGEAQENAEHYGIPNPITKVRPF